MALRVSSCGRSSSRKPLPYHDHAGPLVGCPPSRRARPRARAPASSPKLPQALSLEPQFDSPAPLADHRDRFRGARMNRPLTLAALVVLVSVGLAAQARRPAKAAAAPTPFSIVEATIPEMRAAMERGARHLAGARRRSRCTRIAHVRGPAERGHHRQSQGAGRGRGARSRTRGRQGARAAARHPGRAEGQHPHDGHAHHGRRAGLRGLRAALRGHADEEPARGRRHHHRQDRA